MIIYSIITTTIIIINAIIIYKIKKQNQNYAYNEEVTLEQIRELSIAINLMAEDMATDYHSKEWIIEHYLSEVKNGSRRGN